LKRRNVIYSRLASYAHAQSHDLLSCADLYLNLRTKPDSEIHHRIISLSLPRLNHPIAELCIFPVSNGDRSKAVLLARNYLSLSDTGTCCEIPTLSESCLLPERSVKHMIRQTYSFKLRMHLLCHMKSIRLCWPGRESRSTAFIGDIRVTEYDLMKRNPFCPVEASSTINRICQCVNRCKDSRSKIRPQAHSYKIIEKLEWESMTHLYIGYTVMVLERRFLMCDIWQMDSEPLATRPVAADFVRQYCHRARACDWSSHSRVSRRLVAARTTVPV
jgi:hypothetical protein